jgi:hypothetical protein
MTRLRIPEKYEGVMHEYLTHTLGRSSLESQIRHKYFFGLIRKSRFSFVALCYINTIHHQHITVFYANHHRFHQPRFRHSHPHPHRNSPLNLAAREA